MIINNIVIIDISVRELVMWVDFVGSQMLRDKILHHWVGTRRGK